MLLKRQLVVKFKRRLCFLKARRMFFLLLCSIAIGCENPLNSAESPFEYIAEYNENWLPANVSFLSNMDVDDIESVEIRYFWTGLSTVAPVFEKSNLIRTDEGFQGFYRYVLSHGYTCETIVAGQYEVSIKLAETALKALTKPVLDSSEYEPAFFMYDSYPRYQIVLKLVNGNHIVYYTESQGRYATPWKIQLGSSNYVIDSKQLIYAFEAMRPPNYSIIQSQLQDRHIAEVIEQREANEFIC